MTPGSVRQDVWRCRPNPSFRSNRQCRPALYELPLNLAVLTDASGLDHGPQSPRRGFWGRGRNWHGISGLRLDHSESEWHHRDDHEGERIRDLVVRQGPQHSVLSGDPGWAVRPVADWHGLRVFLRLCRGDTSQWEPNVFRNTTPIYPYQGNPGWNLTTAMADEAVQYMKQLKELAPDNPFFVYFVPGGTTRRIIRRRNGSRRSATGICSMPAGTKCGRRSSPIRSGSASCPKMPN